MEVDHTQRLNNSTTVTSCAFYDGWENLVESRTPAPNNQDVVRYLYHDQSGRTAFQSVAYFVSAYTGSPGAAAYSIPDSTQPGTSHTYDGLGPADEWSARVMGRQISVTLSYDEEHEVLNEVRRDGFSVVPENLPSPLLSDHSWEVLPDDDHVQPWDLHCVILPSVLARRREACSVGTAGPEDPMSDGYIPNQLRYFVNTGCLPCIEWDRNRRIGPATVKIPGGGGRLYVATQAYYGADNEWKEAILAEYEKLVKLIRRWTVRRGRWGYWSRSIEPPPSEEEYQRLLAAARRA